MELKPGYKQTEVGVIPEDWKLEPIEDLGKVASGKRLPLGNYLTRKETPYPYIRVTDMRGGSISPENIQYVPTDVYPAIKQYRIFVDDIFISVAGTLGIVGKIPQSLNGANLTENANRITSIKCNRDYLLFFLRSNSIQNTIESIRTVGAQPKLALTRIRKFQIPLPPTKREQEAIAGALSDADELIASLEQLIEKKRMIKQGAMQELLTGKKRLPGFQQNPGYKQTEVGEVPEDWEVKALNEVLLSFQNGYGFSAAGYETTGVPIVTMAQIGLDGTFVFNEDKLNYWNARSAESMKSFFLSDGDVIIAMTDVTPDKNLIGRLAITKIQDIALLNQRVGLLRLNKDLINKHYLAPLSSQKTWRNYCMASATLGVQANLGTKAIKAIPIPFPSKREQDAIASVLSDMDAEIEVLQKKLEKARKIKAGMMHNLLAGTIRLV